MGRGRHARHRSEARRAGAIVSMCRGRACCAAPTPRHGTIRLVAAASLRPSRSGNRGVRARCRFSRGVVPRAGPPRAEPEVPPCYRRLHPERSGFAVRSPATGWTGGAPSNDRRVHRRTGGHHRAPDPRAARRARGRGAHGDSGGVAQGLRGAAPVPQRSRRRHPLPSRRCGARGRRPRFEPPRPDAGREHRAPRRGRLGLRAARARRGSAREDPRRRPGQQSGLLSDRLRASRAPPRRRRNGVERRASVVPCGLGVLRGRAPAHRALRGAWGRAPGIAVARPPVCARPGAQAPAGDGALRRNRPRAGVLADGRALRAGDAHHDPAARRHAGGGRHPRDGARVPGGNGIATSPASRCCRSGPRMGSTPDSSIRSPPTGRIESISSSVATTPGCCSSRVSTTSARERRGPRCRI